MRGKGEMMADVVSVSLPYGKGAVDCKLPRRRVRGVLEPREVEAGLPPGDVLAAALRRPIGIAGRLGRLARGRKKILLISSDQTRPVPSRITLPLLLDEISSKEAEVKLLIATGLHSPPSRSEMEEKYGKDNLERFSQIIIHRSSEDDEQFHAGRLSTGMELEVNKELMAEGQLTIAEGFIEPHFFAGFTGGPKSVLPGVAGARSIMFNHSADRIDDPLSRSGVLRGNPIQEEMREASLKAGLGFVLNVILDGKKEIAGAVAGETLAAHEAGCAMVSERSKVKAAPSEIVVTSNNGFPLDRNLYQMVKGLSAAALTVKRGGVIVIVGECVDGVGHGKFQKMLEGSESPEDLLLKIRSGEINEEDQWEAQILAKVLEIARVIVVSGGLKKSVVERMHMLHASSLEEALDRAFELAGPEGKVTFLPRGPATIVA
ncbi:MAG: nickel-dependent lactate racemase [Candidatus Brockarchaeota archaeon]|nr:nickel-dependent lactate racemase [Candidatus Brockarchaeota archaeon]